MAKGQEVVRGGHPPRVPPPRAGRHRGQHPADPERRGAAVLLETYAHRRTDRERPAYGGPHAGRRPGPRPRAACAHARPVTVPRRRRRPPTPPPGASSPPPSANPAPRPTCGRSRPSAPPGSWCRSSRPRPASAPTGAHGLASDKEADMSVVMLQAADGRRALLAFTGLDALQTWRADARPVPVTLDLAAKTARAEGGRRGARRRRRPAPAGDRR